MRQNYEPPIQDKEYDEEMGKRVLERAKQVVAAESKSQRRRKRPRSLLIAMILALVVLLTPAGIFAWQTIYPASYPTGGEFQSHYVLELPGAELLSRYTSEGQLDESYTFNGLSIAISENHNQLDDSAAIADSTPADYVMEVDGGIKARCYLDDDGAYAYLYSTRCLYMVIVSDGTQEDLNLVLSHLRRN